PTMQINNNNAAVVSLDPTYAGVAGAIDDPTAATAYNESALFADTGGASGCASNTSEGTYSLGGVLIPLNPIGIGQISDGTSNTLMVVEQSDWCRDASGHRLDCRASWGYGFQIGVAAYIWSTSPPACDHNETFNLTAAASPINSKSSTFTGA